jgi:hypothetical protein
MERECHPQDWKSLAIPPGISIPAFGCFALNLIKTARLVAPSRRAAAHSQLTAHVARHAAALPHLLEIARRALNNSCRSGWRALGRFNERAAEQRHAPDRRERQCHPPDWMPLSMLPGG